jgi:outer membrane autotransporter protein
VSANGTLDVSVKYLWTRQEGGSERGESTLLATGGKTDWRLKFDDVDSQRLRLGARYSAAFADQPNLRWFAGLAVEQEFDAEAKLKVNGVKVDDEPDLKGATGIVEAGISLAPSANSPWSVDIGVQGMGGKREGASGSAAVNYRF